MARGLGLGQALNAFATGAMQGANLNNMLDEQKFRVEDRGLALADRDRKIRLQDEELDTQRKQRSKEEEAGFVMEQWARARGGLDVDREGLKRYGINPEKHFDPKIGEWAEVAQGVLSGQIQGDDPKALELLNWRLSDQIGKGIGAKVEAAYTSIDGQQIPAGAEIIDKKVIGMKPAAGGESLVAALRVTAKLPDGKTISYVAPATEGRSTDPNAKMLQIPTRSLIQMAQGDSLIADAWRSPEFQKELEARLAGLTGKIPQREKAEEITREEGGDKVTYSRAPDGSLTEVARAPRWQPEKPEKPTSEIREYMLAKQEGFEGTFMDYKKAAKGGGFSVTTPDGTIVQMGGGGGELAKPTVNALEEKIVNAQSGLDRLRQVGQKFDPSFLKIQNQAGTKWSEVKDKVGLSNPQDRAKIEKYESFKSSVLDNLNLYIKEITGAAMSQAEAGRITAAMPNMDDGPTAFKSKYDRVIESLSRSMARAYYTRQNGLTMEAVPLDQMDKIIDDYGNKLERQILSQNPGMKPEEAERLALPQVKRNFGM